MKERRDVEFEGHGGTILRGWLYLPHATAEVPAVVMAHGLSAVKEMVLDRYAEVLCDGGMAVLVYDHRNLGASDGEPRQKINPWAQARDYRHAITWLGERRFIMSALPSSATATPYFSARYWQACWDWSPSKAWS